jgi:hypothetical protein
MTGLSSLWPALSSLPLIPSESAPFGPLSPLHEYIIAHAEDITLSNAVYALGIPFAPLALQAFLLQREGTRVWRGAIAVLGLVLILRAWTGYRMTREWSRHMSCSFSRSGVSQEGWRAQTELGNA